VNVSAAVTLIARQLEAAGVEQPRREARILLAAALRTDAAGLLGIATIDPGIFEPLLARRKAREPLAYITGRREFWGLDFAVSPATLIPRADSETLIEAALAAFPSRGAVQTILDLGTGTGCLLLAALHEFTHAFGVGIDLSPAAAKLARANATQLGLASRAIFFAGNWAEALHAKFDLILSNPPYIPGAEIARLMPEVAKFEPAQALNGGPDGLAAYRAIIAGLAALLAPGGAAILELGIGQSQQVAALAAQHGLSSTTRADLGDIPRALVIRPQTSAPTSDPPK
jgi:release factor glutamine methyltransferase